MAQKTATVANTRLMVRDFGPIAKADIGLRPLTIFLGPSNTGKSYLAMLIYSLSRYFSTANYVSLAATVNSKQRSAQSTDTRRASPSNLQKKPKPPMSSGSRSNSTSGKVLPLDTSSDEAGKALETLFDVLFGTRATLLPNNRDFDSFLRETFGVETTQELSRIGAKHSSQVAAIGSGPTGETLAEFRTSLNSPKTTAELVLSPELDVGQLPVVPHSTRKQVTQNSKSESALDISTTIGEFIEWYATYAQVRKLRPFGLLEYGAQYLPAGRTGVVDGHKAIMASLVQQATQDNPRPNGSASVLPDMLGEYFLNLMNTRNQRSPYADIAEALETDILGGRILDDRENDLGYPNLFYHPSHWSDRKRIPLIRASSMITELAPIILYLRHVVKENELLIIEEPEAHLHPAMQAELAVYLAKLVNSGLRVVLTTHSEWLLEQFTNLVRFSEISRGQQKTIEAQHPSIAGSALDMNQVGAWVFTPPKGNRGSTVEEFALNEGSGMMPEQYAEVMKRLYDEWRQIAHQLDAKAA